MKLLGKIMGRGAAAAGQAKLARDKRGNVIAIAAVSLPLVVGAMGLGVDFTQWVLWKRNLQGAADTAALSAAKVIGAGGTTANMTSEGTKVVNHNASTAFIPRTLTQINRIASPGQNFATGQTAATHGTSVEVILQAQGPRYFSGMFMNSAPTIRTRSVAGPRGAGLHCFMGLHPTAPEAVRIWGNAFVTSNCGVISNSNHAQAAVIGGSAQLTTTAISAVGNVVNSATLVANTVTSGAAAQPDPLGPQGRNIQRPTCASYANFPSSGNATPGCYRANSVNISGTVTMAQGVYVFDGNQSINLNGGTLNGSAGVSIVLTGGANLQVSGNVNLNLRAMETSQADTLYGPSGTLIANDARRQALAGVVIWQADPGNQPNRLNGNAAVTLNGAIYTPHSDLIIQGNFSAQSTCVQLIASTLNITGSGSFPNTCPTNDPNFGAFGEPIEIVLAE